MIRQDGVLRWNMKAIVTRCGCVMVAFKRSPKESRELRDEVSGRSCCFDTYTKAGSQVAVVVLLLLLLLLGGSVGRKGMYDLMIHYIPPALFMVIGTFHLVVLPFGNTRAMQPPFLLV